MFAADFCSYLLAMLCVETTEQGCPAHFACFPQTYTPCPHPFHTLTLIFVSFHPTAAAGVELGGSQALAAPDGPQGFGNVALTR